MLRRRPLAPRSLEQSLPSLQTDEQTHLHLFSLLLAKREHEEIAIALLSSAEVAALAKIKASQRRCEFLYGRALLRRLLACYVGAAPEDVVIEINQQGKPWARTVEQQPVPAFNVSHSGDVLAIAVCARGEIGVDVEQTDMKLEKDAEEIAKSQFTGDEYASLMGRPTGQRLDDFFRMWTLKEAVLKATGVGLYQPLNLVDVAEPAERYRILLKEAGKEIRLSAQHWQKENVHVALARVGALARVNIFDHMQGGVHGLLPGPQCG